MTRKKHSLQTRFTIYLFFCIGIPFIVFALFLNLYINQIRGWIHYSAIESVLKKEGIECEGTIISWRLQKQFRRDVPGVTERDKQVERYYKHRKPTVEFFDQHGNKHSFESLYSRRWHPIIVNVSIPVTFAKSNPSIVLDNEARVRLAWGYPIFFIMYTFVVIFSVAFFVSMIVYWRDEYERGLPKAERKRRRRERRLRQREREQRDNVS